MDNCNTTRHANVKGGILHRVLAIDKERVRLTQGWPHNTEWSVLKCKTMYIQTTKIEAGSLYLCAHIHGTIIVKEKEANNLRVGGT